MTADHSIISLIINASVPVQLVMLILACISVLSWAIIFNKSVTLKRAQKNAVHFEKRFWAVEDLAPLYTRMSSHRYKKNGMEKIFVAGFVEFVRIKKQNKMDMNALLDVAQRSMRTVMHREIDQLEARLSFLATTGSTSPYIGLFGTVWGIMNSFQALGGMQQVTIAMVAPGISEALIATAMGLFAAIPAVIAYNHFSHDTDRLLNRYDNFIEEFATILHRHAQSLGDN